MSVTLEQLLLSLEVNGSEEVKKQLKAVKDETKKVGEEAKKTTESFSVLPLEMTRTLVAGRLLFSTFTSLIQGFGKFSGIDAAAEMIDLRLALEGVTGSAASARKELAELTDLSLHSAFDVQDLAKYAAQMKNLGVATGNLTGDLRKIADLGALSRVPGADAGRFAEAFINLRSAPKVRIGSLREIAKGLPLGELVSAGIGKGSKLSTTQAEAYLQHLNGAKAYDLLLKGADALGKGAAAADALASPVRALAVGMKELQLIMEPTGELLIAAIRPFAGIALEVANGARKFNELTGGVAGLALIGSIAYRSWGLARTTISAAIIKTQELTAALNAYAATATVVSSATRANATANGVGTAAQAAALLKNAKALGPVSTLRQGALSGPSSPIYGLPGTIARIRGGGVGAAVKGAFGGVAARGAGILKNPNVALLLADIAGNFIADKLQDGEKHGSAKYVAGGVLSGAVNGASLGALVGSIIPGIGTAVGGAVGAVVGGIKGYFDSRGNADERTASATESIAKSMEELKSKLTGGGERARAITSDIEIQYSLANALGRGFG